ncbi:glycine radical enzyme, YjjI family [Kluyvera cryocrescens]|uniref:Glycine radical enzyme, YjjI family n=1 Tax=Kluyvera cryocrescens TaxID=580 RepID=A0A485BFD8_KLUCR|nr:glycine radical enzyme, YjjI family [Kluyvera cryocrescens]
MAQNICECSKPHIANGPQNDKIFTKGQYGIVSCYNSLPVAGGGSTLVRMNLQQVALRSRSLDDFSATSYRATASCKPKSSMHAALLYETVALL